MRRCTTGSLRRSHARSPADRWAVVEDLAAFLVSGEIDWPLYERAVRILGATTDRLVVESFSATLLQLGLMYPAASAVQRVARGFFADRLAAIGGSAVPDENPTHGILRERLSLARARLDLGFARDLTELFPEWERLDPNVRGAVAVARARADGASGWAELRRALDLQPPEAERTQLERGLAWSSDPDRVAATLGLLDSGAIVRSHIVATLVQVAANPVGRPLLWPWFRDHLPVLGEQLRGSSSFGMMLESVVPMIGLGRGEEIRTFFRDHPLPEGSRGIAKGLQRLEVYERLAGRLTHRKSVDAAGVSRRGWAAAPGRRRTRCTRFRGPGSGASRRNRTGSLPRTRCGGRRRRTSPRAVSVSPSRAARRNST